MALTRAQFITLGAVTAATALTGARSAGAADAKHYSFGYDQPNTTAYGLGADLFGAKLAELSKGTMVIDQFPGAQLGQEPQMLQKIRTGDIDFMFSASANAATLSPQSGVLSIHFLFRSEDAPGAAPSPRPAAGRGGARDVRRDGEGRTLPDAGHASDCATSTARRRCTRWRTSRTSRSACRRRRPRTPCSPPMARRSSTCRSARSTPACRPAWWTWPRTASTSTTATSTTRSRRSCR